MSNLEFKNTISVSQVNAFNECAYKWQLMYKENTRVRKGEVTPFAIGSVVHEGMAAALRRLYALQSNKRMRPIQKTVEIKLAASTAIIEWATKNKADKLIVLPGEDDTSMVSVIDENYIQDWNDMIDNAFLIVSRLIDHMELVRKYEVIDVVIAGEKIPLIEHDFSVELGYEIGLPKGQYAFTGRIDAVLRDLDTGIVGVYDWKCHAKFTSLNDEQLNAQIALYQHALNKLYDLNINMGVVYQIKRDPPRRPTLNKNGTMSRRDIISDWATYEAELLRHDLNPTEYIDEMEPKLASQEFYRPLIVFRNPHITQKFWDNLLRFARTIINETNFPMAMGYPCRRCVFNALCNARIYELDEEGLFEDRYMIGKEAEIIAIDDLEENIGT